MEKIRWKKKEINKLKKLYKQEKSNKEIAIILNRSKNSIDEKAVRLNLSKSKRLKYKIQSRFQKGQNIGKKNGQWKGKNVGYHSLHNWIRRYKPKPKLCQDCHKEKPYDLANISGKYKRDVKDFKWVCRRCHMKKDGRLVNFKKYVGQNKPCLP